MLYLDLISVKLYFLSVRPFASHFPVLDLSYGVLGLSSFVFLLSLQCLRDALVMSQACPQVSTYSSSCLCQDLFHAEGFSNDSQRKSERPNTFHNMSFSLIANRKTFEVSTQSFARLFFTIY